MSCGSSFTPTTVKTIQRSWSTLQGAVKDGEVAIPMLVFKKCHIWEYEVSSKLPLDGKLYHQNMFEINPDICPEYAQITPSEEQCHNSKNLMSQLSFFSDYPTTIYYFRRFGDNPETIMKNERFIQHAKNNVYRSLDKAIGILDQPEELNKVAAWIGQIHKSKEIKREDFSHLGIAIVKSVKQALGNKLTREDEAAWKTVIDSLMCTFANFSSN